MTWGRGNGAAGALKAAECYAKNGQQSGPSSHARASGACPGTPMKQEVPPPRGGGTLTSHFNSSGTRYQQSGLGTPAAPFRVQGAHPHKLVAPSNVMTTLSLPELTCSVPEMGSSKQTLWLKLAL